MRKINLNFFLNEISFFKKEAKKGKIFIYPTDTIYGIGAIVNRKTTKKINKIKQRPFKKNFSIIAPNYTRIQKYFKNTENIVQQWKQRQKQFPGRGLTILLEPNTNYQQQAKLLSGNKLVGIRIIQSPLQNFITELDEAFVTTSVNISGQKNIKNTNNIDKNIQENIDYIIHGEILDNPPSIIINGINHKILRI